MANSRDEIIVRLGDRSYPIVVCSGATESVGPFARGLCRGRAAFLVCDSNTARPAQSVARSLRGVFDVVQDTVPCGEESKSLANASALYDRLTQMKADRQTLVVAVGGGVVGDLAGFVAATYARGIPLLQVPTSLLAQVDSSVGGKVAVNHHGRDGRITKNMIGAFHQPVGVFIDTDALATLPAVEFRAGLAEVVKYGVIQDAEFFGYIEQHAGEILALDAAVLRHIVARSCRLKADIIEQDERETTERRSVLNFGHTVAHAIESVSREFRHGEAVAMGMVATCRLAQRLGRIDHTLTERLVRLLDRCGLPTALPDGSVEAMVDAMQRDKKSQAGQIRFVLPTRLGEVGLPEPVDVELVRDVLAGGDRIDIDFAQMSPFAPRK
jgi:3-dehydroquinate synthase